MKEQLIKSKMKKAFPIGLKILPKKTRNKIAPLKFFMIGFK